jgi:Flp pilus assembly pilin Flp
MLRIFIEDDAGQGTVEYALVISLLSVVAIASLKVLGRKANVTFEQAARHLK